VGGFTWWARVEWIQGQRPMWREHDAKLASVWRRDESDIDIAASTVAVASVDTVIVLPEPVESVAQSA
jgi:hypothetical protein